jgi:DNA-binding CsgD family transcriptional regulator
VTAADDAKLAFTLATRTVEEYEDPGDGALADAYAYLAHHAMVRIQHDAAIEFAEKALELSREPSPTRCTALISVAVVRNETSYPDGNRLLTEAKEMATLLGLQREWWWAQLNLILGAAANKDIDLARAYNEETRTEIGDDDLAVTSFHISKVAELAILNGDYKTAESTLESLGRSADDSVWWMAWSRALLQVRTGAPAMMSSARHFKLLAVTLDEPHPIFHAATTWAELLFVYERTDAEITSKNLETLADLVAFDIPWWIADLALWLWLDGHIDRIPERAADPVHWIANGDWEKAARWYAKKGLPYEQAVCLNLGDQPARLVAVEVADRIGASALSAKFRRRLRADGVKRVPPRPRIEERQGRLGLTGRQDQVLSLLAERMTNSEIAERLFISPRTVEKHVAAVISKLGAADRRDVVSVARDAGWRSTNG